MEDGEEEMSAEKGFSKVCGRLYIELAVSSLSLRIALLKLLEGTTVTLQAKPGATHSAPSPTTAGRFTDSHREPPTQRGFGGSLGSSQHDLGYGPKKGVREGLPLHGGGGGGGSSKPWRCQSGNDVLKSGA